MATKTDVSATHIHGTDPQYLIEKISRIKIYESNYYKEKCFGLSAATIGHTHIHITHTYKQTHIIQFDQREEMKVKNE